MCGFARPPGQAAHSGDKVISFKKFSLKCFLKFGFFVMAGGACSHDDVLDLPEDPFPPPSF